MKKAYPVAIAILTLTISLLGAIQVIDIAKANMMFPFWYANIHVQSPQNQTYNANIMLNFTVETYNPEVPTYYILNSRKPVHVETHVISNKSEIRYPLYTLEGNATLRNLADGTHYLTIHVGDDIMINSTTVVFTIDAAPPSVEIVQLDKTYNSTQVPLNFNVDETVQQITYSLDNQANVTATGNTTLTGLSDGSHSIIVYATDLVGNVGVSKTAFFSVKTELLPWWLMAEIVAGAAIVSLFALYSLRRKRK